jgi:hypothetical protein
MSEDPGFIVKIQADSNLPFWIACESVQNVRWLGSRAEAQVYATRSQAQWAGDQYVRLVAGRAKADVEVAGSLADR